MSKRNHRHLNQVYSRPLPLILSSEIYGPLPNIYPHNPLSWVYLGYKLFVVNYIRSVPQASVDKIVVRYDTNFIVDDEIDMSRLWNQGFFGKGNLSRSEPTWKSRLNRRINNENDKSKEDMTNLRRQERKTFKLERSKIQQLELKMRTGEMNEAEVRELTLLKNSEKESTVDSGSQSASVDDILDLQDLEYVQLEPTEVFFLKFALNVIEVDNMTSLKQLFQACCSSTSARDKFILDYVVYHHYRSLGWCVRSGIKFGSDFLLYKRGPPFSHAEYTVNVIANDDKTQDWVDLSALGRVSGAVKKNFVLAYVDYPSDERFESCWNGNDNEKEMFIELMSLYKVTEVIYKRWVPSKSRD